MPVISKEASRTSRHAIAAVEFAAILPLLLTLLVGIWEVGRMIEMQQVLTNAAREGGRQAATGQYTDAQVQTIVTQYLSTAGIPITHATVTVADLTSPASDVSQASYLDNLQVSVSIPYSDVSWSLTSLITTANTQITATVQWLTMVDKPYPNQPEPPVG